MPVYEYLCNDCGPFTDMRPMAECDDPQDCPRCETESPRVILTAPAFFCMPSDKRKAIATNERSAHAPKTLGRIQGRARPRLWLLFNRKEEAGAAGDQDQRAEPRAFRPHVHG